MEIEYKKRVWKKEFETLVNKNINDETIDL